MRSPVMARMNPQWLTTSVSDQSGSAAISARNSAARATMERDRLLHRRPPHLVQRREIVLGPGPLEFGARRADVAGEGVALAHHRVDDHRHAEPRGDRGGGLQRAGIGRNDDAGGCRLAGQRLGGLRGLFVAKRRQFRVGDAGVAPVAVNARLNSLWPWRSRIMARDCRKWGTGARKEGQGSALDPPRAGRPLEPITFRQLL